ncbi:MAG: hypothetical protein ACI8RZ_007482, partial [Myxococcota bacterium]
VSGFGDTLSGVFDGIGGGGGSGAPGGDGDGGGLLAVAGSIPEPVTQAVVALLSAASQIGAAGLALEDELASAKESGDTDRVAEIEAAIAEFGSSSGAAVAESLEASFAGLLEGLKVLPEVLGSVVIPELIKIAPQIVRGLARTILLLPFEIAGSIFQGIGAIFEEGLGNALRRWWEGLIDNFINLIADILNPFSRDDKPASDADIAATVAIYEARNDALMEEASNQSALSDNHYQTNAAKSTQDSLLDGPRLRRLQGLLLPNTEAGGLTIAALNRAAGGGARRAMAGRDRESGGGGQTVNFTVNTDIADSDAMRRTTRRLENTESTFKRVRSGRLGST